MKDDAGAIRMSPQMAQQGSAHQHCYISPILPASTAKHCTILEIQSSERSMSQPEQYATCIDLITMGTRTKLSVFSLHDGPSLSHNIAAIRGLISIANKPTVACYKANPSGHYLLYPVYTCTSRRCMSGSGVHPGPTAC